MLAPIAPDDGARGRSVIVVMVVLVLTLALLAVSVMIAFVIAQSLLLSKYIQEEKK